MIIYLLLLSIGVVAFWIYYRLALKANTHFGLVRFYFLVALLASLLIPLMDQFQMKLSEVNSLVNQQINEVIDETIITPVANFKSQVAISAISKSKSFNWLFLLYLTGCAVLFVRAIVSTFSIIGIRRSSKKSIHQGAKLYFSAKINQPFSLFQSIYLPAHWYGSVPLEVMDHEMVHIKQWHFIDLLLTELLTIAIWFNPIAYLLKKDVRANLEFLADEAVINKGRNVCHYQALLLSVATNGDYQAPLTMYFNVPLKNRIKMMTKKKTGVLSKIALLGMLPITGLLMAFTINSEVNKPLKKLVEPIANMIEEDNKPSVLPLDRHLTTRVSSDFGMRMHPVLKVEKMHTGIDLVAKIGTPVYATADGTIEMAEFNTEHGYFVQIKHSEKYQTKYSHLKDFIVMPNTFVTEGQIIGYVGSTGKSFAPHLHFEIHVDGEQVDPKSVLKELENC